MLHLRFRPPDITVAQQGHQVIGDRSHDRILEIDHRQLVLASEHQVAAVKIPVHQHPGLLQGTVDQLPKKITQQGLLSRSRRVSQQSLHKPLLEAAQFLTQQGSVVFTKASAAAIHRRHFRQHFEGATVVAVHRSGHERRQ